MMSGCRYTSISSFFFFNDTATTEIYTLSLHDALPISLKLDVGSDACIQCCVYATNHGRQMRHERKTDAPSYGRIQPLPNLWPMTMAGNAIGFEIIRSFGEEQMLFGFLAGTAHPGLRVRDQVIKVDGPGFRKGQQAELNRGRIAPRIRHQVRALDFCAIHFRQTVDCLWEMLLRGGLDLQP